jgi:hypothetical protein
MSLSFPIEIWETIWVKLHEHGSSALIPCASTSSTWRAAIFPRLVASITIFIEDFWRRLEDEGCMSALQLIHHHARQLTIVFKFGSLTHEVTQCDLGLSYGPASTGAIIIRPGSHSGVARTFAIPLPLFPQVARLIIRNVQFCHFESLFACADLVGSALTHIHLINIDCTHDYAQPLTRRRKPLRELVLPVGKPELARPLLRWIRLLTNHTGPHRLQFTTYDTDYDQLDLHTLIRRYNCSIRELDICIRPFSTDLRHRFGEAISSSCPIQFLS